MSTCPNLFLIGAAKGGSSSFAFHLTDHPDIAFFSEKEPNFFNQESVEACRRRLLDRAHLAPDTRYVLDASVNYSQFPKFTGVPRHIADIHSPDVTRVKGATNKQVSRQSRFPALNRFVRSGETSRRLVKSLLPHKRQLQLTRALSKEVAREEVDTRTRARLADIFTDSIARTEELIGQDLSIWKADRSVPV